MTENAKKNSFLLNMLDSFLKNSPDMIFIKDKNLVYIGASDTFAKLVGFNSAKELIGKSDYDIFKKDLADKYTKDDKAVLKNGNIIDNIEQTPEKNGFKQYCSTSKYLIRDKHDHIIGLYGISRDVSSQVNFRNTNENRQFSRNLYDVVVEADISENKIIVMNGSAKQALFPIHIGDDLSNFVKSISSQISQLDSAEAFIFRFSSAALMDAYKKGCMEFTDVYRLNDNDQEYRWIEFKTRLYFSQISKTLRMTILISDIDELTRSKERLQKKAETDSLTGLCNRDNVFALIEQCLLEKPNQKNALLFVDLDNFKNVNLNFGHPFGDEVLLSTAQHLRRLFRSSDIIGRIGGDKFLVFLPNIIASIDIEEKVRRMILSMPRCTVHDTPINITCSVGIVICQGKDYEMERLCYLADKAMSRAKENGKNQLFVFEH